MAKTVRPKLEAIVKALEEKEKQGANSDALKVLYDILEVVNELDQRLALIEKEVGLPDSFIDISKANIPTRLRP